MLVLHGCKSPFSVFVVVLLCWVLWSTIQQHRRRQKLTLWSYIYHPFPTSVRPQITLRHNPGDWIDGKPIQDNDHVVSAAAALRIVTAGIGESWWKQYNRWCGGRRRWRRRRRWPCDRSRRKAELWILRGITAQSRRTDAAAAAEGKAAQTKTQRPRGYDCQSRWVISWIFISIPCLFICLAIMWMMTLVVDLSMIREIPI